MEPLEEATRARLLGAVAVARDLRWSDVAADLHIHSSTLSKVMHGVRPITRRDRNLLRDVLVRRGIDVAAEVLADE